jgi:PPM family protein phosphatase
MDCPNCGTVVLESDRFCEECGTALIEDEIASSAGCQKCGANVEALDAEGYCSNCGFRNVLAEPAIVVVKSAVLAGVSDPGLRHPHNEDSLALATVDSAARSTQILVVCDGVSSSQNPDRAAQVAAETICQELTRSLLQQPADRALKMATAKAAAAVSALPYFATDDIDSPSTTLVAAIVQNNMATIGWLGDSRAYWLSAQGSRQLTIDDSWLNEVVNSGELSLQAAQQSPNAHAITRWLGADAKDNVEPAIVQFKIPGSGYLLLCSDGLWNYAPEADQIADLIRRTASTDAATVAQYLVEFARSQGGRDNITVAILAI